MISPASGTNTVYGTAAASPTRTLKTEGGQRFADALATASRAGGAASSENELDTVTLSGNSGMSPLLGKSAIILPTMKNVRILSSALKDELGSFFRDNGISIQPPVELSVNSEGRIVVTGDRADAARIEECINADPTLSEDIRTLNALAGTAHDLPRHLQFQAEYRASRNPEAVVAKYSDLFYPRPHTFSMRYGAEESDANLELLADGEVWEQTNIPTEAWADSRIASLVESVEESVEDTITGLGEE